MNRNLRNWTNSHRWNLAQWVPWAWQWGLVVLATAALCGCGRRGDESTTLSRGAVSAVDVTVAKAERRQRETTIEVVGTLRGWEQVLVGAKKSGRVMINRRDVGDRVEPGEVLVEIERINYELIEQQAQRRLNVELARLGLADLPPENFDVAQLPAVEQARVALERAEQKQRRQRELGSRQMTSEESLENAAFDVEGARAALEQAVLTARATLAMVWSAKVELDVARQALEDTQVRAPVPSNKPPGGSGPLSYAVTRRSTTEGQMVREGEGVCELVIDDPLRLWVNVPERFTPFVSAGQQVRVTVTAFPEESFAGRVERVNPAVDERNRTFQVEVSVENSERRLRPGSFAKAAIVVRHGEKLMVPSEAVVRFAGVTKVYAVREGTAVAIPVEVGQEEGGWIEVEGELQPADTVVTGGVAQLADGSRVTIRRGEEQPAAAPMAGQAAL